MSNLIVLGAQWGDEGKGKIVDLFSDKFDAVIVDCDETTGHAQSIQRLMIS